MTANNTGILPYPRIFLLSILLWCVLHHPRLWSYQNCYLQFPDKQICPFLASFPEWLISLQVLKLRFIFGLYFCSFWCWSNLFLQLWHHSTAKPWPLLVWCMHVSASKSLPLLGMCFCSHRLSAHTVLLWVLKWWLVFTPVLGLRKGLLCHFILWFLESCCVGTGRDPTPSA